MNKEEILQRSRHETQKNKGDELETMNKDKSDHIASSLIFYFILLLNIFNYMNIISGTINIGSKAISLTGLLVSLIIIFIVVKLSCMYYFSTKSKVDSFFKEKEIFNHGYFNDQCACFSYLEINK